MDVPEIDAQSLPERRELVRRFSNDVGPTVKYPNVIHAVADYTKQDRAKEAAKWRPHFQGPSTTSGNLAVNKLNVESQVLAKIIEAVQEAGTGHHSTFDDVSTAVMEAQKVYETKKRLLSGRPQKVYHDVMCNLDAHAGVLSMIPQSNTMCVDIPGQASVSHRQNIADLTNALKTINDEARACTADTELVQSEATFEAIAKFYTTTFLFYGDAIKWFRSSSAVKVWHSLDQNFSVRFTQPLAEIKRLSKLVQRATARGSGAETRITRLAVEDVTEDLRAGLQGFARETAKTRQFREQILMEQERTTAAMNSLRSPELVEQLADLLWQRLGISGTALLVDQNMQSKRERLVEGAGSPSQAQLLAIPKDGHEASGHHDIFTISRFSVMVEPLLDGIAHGMRLADIDYPFSLTLDQRIAIALKSWTLSTTSTLLYLEAELPCIEARLPQVTVAAARMIKEAEQIELPTISFFCDVAAPDHVQHSRTKDEEIPPLLGLVYSLIYQLSKLIPPLTDMASVVPLSQAASLKPSLTSWPSSLQILSNLLKIAPPFLLCIIDGYYAFESSTTNSAATHELLEVLRKTGLMEQKVFKTLFTNSSRAFSLVQEVSWDQSEIIEGRGRARDGWGGLPGRTFVDLGFDAAKSESN
ncbi:MAG: hypothetical protein Q9195_002344 [Heterodermia aff. obscurata]